MCEKKDTELDQVVVQVGWEGEFLIYIYIYVDVEEARRLRDVNLVV